MKKLTEYTEAEREELVEEIEELTDEFLTDIVTRYLGNSEELEEMFTNDKHRAAVRVSALFMACRSLQKNLEELNGGRGIKATEFIANGSEEKEWN